MITVFAGVAVSETYPTATIDISDGAVLDIAGDVDLSTSARVKLESITSNSPFGLPRTFKEPYNFPFAFGVAGISSSITLAYDARIDAEGAVTLESEARKDVDVEATAPAGRSGTAGTVTGDDVSLRATTLDLPKLFAYNEIASDSGALNTRETGISVVVTTNIAGADLAENARITASGDVKISADARIPWVQTW